MQIERLRIQNFRCFDAVDLRPRAGVNAVIGDNASGKTSLLEAIFVLGRGHTFRRAGLPSTIRPGSQDLAISAELSFGNGYVCRLGVKRDSRGTAYAKDGERGISRLELVNTLPLQLIDPDVHRLLEQGPRYRRHFMDWGVFHVEHTFFPAWKRYRRTLAQRNKALKARAPKKDIVLWDAELVRCARTIDAARRRYIGDLERRLPQQAARLLGKQPVELCYEPGWRGSEGYGAALAGHLDQDQRAGHTQQGPHRADLRVSVESSAARDWVSRGQQKVLTVAMLLAQAQIMHERRGLRPILLIDDIAAEMGTRYRDTIARAIAALDGQCFVTFLDSGSIPDAFSRASAFHVEHGAVFED